MVATCRQRRGKSVRLTAGVSEPTSRNHTNPESELYCHSTRPWHGWRLVERPLATEVSCEISGLGQPSPSNKQPRTNSREKPSGRPGRASTEKGRPYD